MKLPIALIALCLFAGGVMAECDPSTAWDSFPKLPMGCEPIHVWIDGEPAPIGTYITFSGQNVRDSGYMALTIYGGQQKWSGIGPKLMIQGMQSADKCGMLNIPNDAPITFYVNGIQAKVRINRNQDCGTWYFENSDKTWLDSLPFVDGATYDIELKTGDIEPAPIVEPALTGPCETWDRDNVKWKPEDQYWLDKWESGPKTHEYCECRNGIATCEMQSEKEWIAIWFRGLGADWFVPDYRHEQTEEIYQRMVFFADHGGYGCTPNLTAMVDGQGWYNMYTSYGWPYQIGKFGWSRITASASGENHLPSLFAPPINHPVLVENGYPPSLAYIAENPPTPTTTVPTPVPTPMPTSTPMPRPPYADHYDFGEATTTVPTVEPTEEPTVEPLVQTMLYVEPTTIPTTVPTMLPTPEPIVTPTLITKWSNDGTVCFVLVWDTHIEKYVWARAMLA